MNIAGAAMLAMHGRDLEAIPALAGFEDAVADAAVQATHEEVFIPLLDEMTFDDLFAGRAGLVVVSTVELDDLVSEGEEDYGSPRGWWVTAVDFGYDRWLLYPDDDRAPAYFTVFDPIPVGDDTIALGRLVFGIEGSMTPRRDDSVGCREVVRGRGRSRISGCDSVNCRDRCRLKRYVEGRVKGSACTCTS